MINFKELYLEGFGSIISPYTLKFNKRGLILIKGKNGAGKTSQFSGLFWVLYGKTLKASSTINTWSHIRPSGYKGTLGYITLIGNGKYYKIIRCLEYKGDIIPGVRGNNRLMVLDEDGKEIFSNKKINELQAIITDKIIGLSPELFKSSIIFGQKMKRLVDEDGPTKKKIFEEAFGVNYINNAKDLAYKRFKEIEKELIPLDRAYFGKISAIEAKESALEVIREKMANFENNKKEDILRINNKIIEIQDIQKDMSKHIGSYEVLQKSLRDATESLKVMEKNFDTDGYYDIMAKVAKGTTLESSYKDSLNKYSDKLIKAKASKKCPVCGNKMEDSNHQDHINEIEEEILRFKLALKEVQNNLNGHKITLASLTKKQSIIKSKVSKIKELEDELDAHPFDPISYDSYQRDIKKYLGEIENIKARAIDFGETEAKDELEKLREEAEESATILKSLKKRYQINEWLYTKALSNSGLKAFIFNQMLNNLNIILEEYARQFGIRPYFMVDMNSARKDIVSYAYINGAPVSFSDLSGGQGQLANIITAFATHDLIAAGRFNLLVLDELFESLDNENIEVVSELIHLKTKNQQVYLITHLKNFNPTGAKTLEFILQDGATRPLF